MSIGVRPTKMLREYRRVLSRHGVVLREVTKTAHYHLHARLGDATTTFIVAATPSDNRAIHKFEADVKR